MLDTDELDYFRWISYLLDAIRPSTDFLLYMLVSTKFRASFFTIVSAPCGKAAEWTKRCRQLGWRRCLGVGGDDGAAIRIGDCLLCGKRDVESEETSEGAPFRQ